MSDTKIEIDEETLSSIIDDKLEFLNEDVKDALFNAITGGGEDSEEESERVSGFIVDFQEKWASDLNDGGLTSEERVEVLDAMSFEENFLPSLIVEARRFLKGFKGDFNEKTLNSRVIEHLASAIRNVKVPEPVDDFEYEENLNLFCDSFEELSSLHKVMVSSIHQLHWSSASPGADSLEWATLTVKSTCEDCIESTSFRSSLKTLLAAWSKQQNLAKEE